MALLDRKVLEEGGGRSLEYSVKDGTAFSVMTGFGEQYFSPLAIELGATNAEIGVLASLPLFIASLLQLFTAKATEFLASRKKTIILFVMLQALTWIPLVAIPFYEPAHGVAFLIILVTLYFAFGQFAAPAWNSLMGDLVKEEFRGRFFGMRNRITGATAFFSVFAAGFILSVFPREEILSGFVVIFAVAFLARLISWRYLNLSEDVPIRTEEEGRFSYAQYLQRLRKTNYGRFALYFGAMNLSVYVAGPFFAVYMLRDLQMNYLEYTAVTAAAALTTFLAMTHWGGLGDRFGNKKILAYSSLFLPIVPLMWLISSDTLYLIFAQIFSGFIWAGFNLASMNFIYDNVRPENRTRVFSYHNVLSGTSIFAGSMIGSVLALTLTDPWLFQSTLQILFLISGVMRMVASIIFLPSIKEKRLVEEVSSRDFFLKYNGTGPIVGLRYWAITGIRKSLGRVKN